MLGLRRVLAVIQRGFSNISASGRIHAANMHREFHVADHRFDHAHLRDDSPGLRSYPDFEAWPHLKGRYIQCDLDPPAVGIGYSGERLDLDLISRLGDVL